MADFVYHPTTAAAAAAAAAAASRVFVRQDTQATTVPSR